MPFMKRPYTVDEALLPVHQMIAGLDRVIKENETEKTKKQAVIKEAVAAVLSAEQQIDLAMEKRALMCSMTEGSTVTADDPFDGTEEQIQG